MNKMLLLILCTATVLASCGQATPPVPPPPVSGPSIRALPFTIEKVSLSDLFQNDLKLSKVNVQVDGGSPDEWVATALAIAYEVGKLGANSVEATVDRSDLEGIDAAPLYLHLAKVYFSPDPKRSVWNDQQQLLISITEKLATRDEIERDNEYEKLIEKFNDKGMNPDSAEKKAGAIIAKKFHLPPDWTLYMGGLTDNAYHGTNFNVDSSAATSSLAALDDCMRGKIIRWMRPCD
jgi:hypothetical protein